MEFSSNNYSKIIKLASKKFKFIKFGENYDVNDKIVLWRHDIDFSPQRALVMAKQEADLGLSATYFVQVGSMYYNILEPEITKIIRQIHLLGHELGIHFDASVCEGNTLSVFEQRIKFETKILNQIIENDINVFSLHNPTTLQDINLDELKYFGLINASSPKLLETFKYCSDSNGYWRFETLEDLLLDNKIEKLYVLTHPVWWQEHEIKKKKKIYRSIMGRSASSLEFYDNLLDKNQRKNIK